MVTLFLKSLLSKKDEYVIVPKKFFIEDLSPSIRIEDHENNQRILEF